MLTKVCKISILLLTGTTWDKSKVKTHSAPPYKGWGASELSLVHILTLCCMVLLLAIFFKFPVERPVYEVLSKVLNISDGRRDGFTEGHSNF